MCRNTILLGGGGYRTLSFCGVLDLMDLSGITTWAGVSAGGLVALWYSLGLQGEQIHRIIQKISYDDILDKHLSIADFLHSGSVVPHEKLLQKIQIILDLSMLPVAVTFTELFERTGTKLCLFALNMKATKLCCFSVDSHPHLPIAIAITAGMSLPFLFEPVIIHGNAYVDAASFNNLPITSLGPSETILAMYPHNSTFSMDSFPSRITAAMYLRPSFIQNASLREAQNAYVIVVPKGVDATLFKLQDFGKTSKLGEYALLLRMNFDIVIGLFALFVCADIREAIKSNFHGNDDSMSDCGGPSNGIEREDESRSEHDKVPDHATCTIQTPDQSADVVNCASSQ